MVEAMKSGKSMSIICSQPCQERMIMAGMSSTDRTIISG